jgi:hypothetical protein
MGLFESLKEGDRGTHMKLPVEVVEKDDCGVLANVTLGKLEANIWIPGEEIDNYYEPSLE